MGSRIFVVLAALTAVTASIPVSVKPGPEALDRSSYPNYVPEEAEERLEEHVMATGELNPSHYPAQRAAQVVQHYLNTRYGSPYKWFQLDRVHSANALEVADSGRKYHLDISVQEIISNTTERCSAEVVFPRGERQSSPLVQVSCEGLLQINTTAQEETLYQQYKMSNDLLSLQELPDSFGNIDPGMEPFWHLGGVASSIVMLKESNENTLYNLAQVSNVTQMETDKHQLMFNYHIRLHDVVSQEIINWKLLITWSPGEAVKALQMERLPKCCCNCKVPPNTQTQP